MKIMESSRPIDAAVEEKNEESKEPQKKGKTEQEEDRFSIPWTLSAPRHGWAQLNSPLVNGLLSNKWQDGKGEDLIHSVEKLCGVKASAAEWAHIPSMICKPLHGTRFMLLMHSLIPQDTSLLSNCIWMCDVGKDFFEVWDEVKSDPLILANFWAVAEQCFLEKYKMEARETGMRPLEIASSMLIKAHPRDPIMTRVDSLEDLAKAHQGMSELEEELNDAAAFMSPMQMPMTILSEGKWAQECFDRLPSIIDWNEFDFTVISAVNLALHLNNNDDSFQEIAIVPKDEATRNAIIAKIHQHHDYILSDSGRIASLDEMKLTVITPKQRVLLRLYDSFSAAAPMKVDASESILKCKKGLPCLTLSWACARAWISMSILRIRNSCNLLDLLRWEDAGFVIRVQDREAEDKDWWEKEKIPKNISYRDLQSSQTRFVVPGGWGLLQTLFWFIKVYINWNHNIVYKELK